MKIRNLKNASQVISMAAQKSFNNSTAFIVAKTKLNSKNNMSKAVNSITKATINGGTKILKDGKKVAATSTEYGTDLLNSLFKNSSENFFDTYLNSISEKNKITKEVRDDFENIYKKDVASLDNYSINDLYKDWSKEILGYILYNVFGDIVRSELSVLGYSIKNTLTPSDFDGVEKQEIIAKTISLYTSLKLIKTNLDYLSVYLIPHLNNYDKTWCVENFTNNYDCFQMLGNSFDPLAGTLNVQINNTLRFLREISISCSRVGNLLRNKESGVLSDINLIDVVIPVRVISDWRNKAARITKHIESKDEKEIESYGPMTLIKFNEFCKVLLSPLISEIAKSSYYTISKIVSRDIELIEKYNVDEHDIKRNLFKRISQLKALLNKNIDQNGDLKIKDLTNIIKNKAKNPDFTFIAPLTF